MKKYNKHLKICFAINTICVLLILLVTIISVNMKVTNLRINDEIKYISAKILEQNNHLKIYRSELAIMTSIDSLSALYKAYYNVNRINNDIKVTQIKTVDSFAGYFNTAKKYSHLQE